jgi:hypothetical protein
MAPRHNPVYDLLAFLVGEKYKEPVNKPTIVAPIEKKDASTMMEPVEKKDVSTMKKPTTRTFSTQMETVMENVKPIEVHEGVQRKKEPLETHLYSDTEAKLYNKEVQNTLETRGLVPAAAERKAIRKAMYEDNVSKKQEAKVVKVVEEAAGGGGGAPVVKVKKSKKAEPVAAVRDVRDFFQTAADQEAGSTGNVDFT